MKKFFMFAAMASVALASCVKNEPVATVEQGAAIAFAAPVVAPVTKANVPYPNDVPFKAYAWYHESNYVGNGTAEQLYINGSTFSYNDGSYTDGASYWPKNGMLSFFAYSPATAKGTLAVSGAVGNAGSVALSYTVATAAAASQDDLLYSSWSTDKTVEDQDFVTSTDAPTIPTTPSYTGVELAFHHALSAVEFKAKSTVAAAGKYKIKSITLEEVLNTNTLTCTPAGALWGEAEETTADYTVLADAGEANAIAALTNDSAVNYNNFYLLPQTLATETILTVNYYLANPAGGWIPQSMPIKMKNVTTEWEMGKKYIYTLVFDIDLIKLAPYVVDWEDVIEEDVPVKE